MKRDKHILINVDNDLYNDIEKLSNEDRRKISEYIYLLVSDEINRRLLEKYGSTGFKRLSFYNE